MGLWKTGKERQRKKRVTYNGVRITLGGVVLNLEGSEGSSL